MNRHHLGEMLKCPNVVVCGGPRTPSDHHLLAMVSASAVSIEHQLAPFKLVVEPQPRRKGFIAIVFDAELIDTIAIEALASSGCVGLLWPCAAPIPQAVMGSARQHGLPIIGPRSAGFIHGEGVAAAALPSSTTQGSLALIAQSGSIAAAAMDWAAGRGIGFSWVVTTGAEADVDVADMLDMIALDPATKAVLVQIGTIRDGRKFMSAARACARLKPVVILQSEIEGLNTRGGPDLLRSAAFERAGLVECSTLDGLFDALAALARIPERRRARVITVGNGAGVCALGVDAVLRHGLALGSCSDGSFDAIRNLGPRARRLDGAIDTGLADPAAVTALCKTLLADREIDYVLLILSPQIVSSYQPYIEELLSAQLGQRLVTVWLGLKAAAEARSRCSAAGLATFNTAGQAARALRYRCQYGRSRELLMQTPPHRQHARFDRQAASELVRSNRQGRDIAVGLLEHYDLPPQQQIESEFGFELAIARHTELGTHLSIQARCGPLHSKIGYGFAPLDELLALRILDSMELSLAPLVRNGLGATLQKLSQLAIDQPSLASLSLKLNSNDAGELTCVGTPDVRIDSSPPPDPKRLILAPYPEELERAFVSRKGHHYSIRAVRPEDEPDLIALLQALKPEEVRFRFFASIRFFSHEMVARMTQIDYDRELVLVAQANESGGRVCGVAHLVSEPDSEAAEFAILVHHDHNGEGLGRFLMEQLIDYARRRGWKTIHGDVLNQNQKMLGLASKLGFVIQADPDEPSCRKVELHV